MRDAYTALNGLVDMFYNALQSTNHPVLGVSLLTAISAVLFLRVCFWVIRVITGGKQDTEKGGRIDDNNNYIYRR